MDSVVGFVAVVALGHPLLAVLGTIALGTAWARVCIEAHFPIDVLLGLSLGSALGWAGRERGCTVWVKPGCDRQVRISTPKPR